MVCRKVRTLSKRESKKADTRQRVVDAAACLFLDKGFAQTSVEEITSAAEIAKGTFFNYFDTKEDVLYTVLAQRTATLGETLCASTGAPASPIARIQRLLQLVAADPLTEQLLNQLTMDGKIPIRHTADRPLLKQIIDQVTQGQAIGEVRSDMDPLVIAGMIISVFFYQIGMWQHGYRPHTLSEMIETAVDSLLDGISGPGWSRPS